MEYLGRNKPVNKITPTVSVCIQTYQHASFIAECLDGMLMQVTDFDYEIIVGEDDSTDGTRDICKEYAEKHPHKIRLFLRSEKDKVYVKGIKTGRFNFLENMREARGTFIAICDGDDYWLDKFKLQRQVDFLNANKDFVMCCHNANKVDVNGAFINVFNREKVPCSTDINYFLSHYWYIPTASIMFRNRNLIPPSFFFEVLGVDYALCLVLLADGGLLHYDHEIRSIYRKHGNGLSRNIHKPEIFHPLKINLYMKFNAYTKGRYEELLKGKIEKHAIAFLKEKAVLSLDFWWVVFHWNWYGKKLNRYLFGKIRSLFTPILGPIKSNKGVNH